MRTVKLQFIDKEWNETELMFPVKHPEIRLYGPMIEEFGFPTPDAIWDEVQASLSEAAADGFDEDTTRSASGKLYSKVMSIRVPKEKWPRLFELILEGDTSAVNYETLAKEGVWVAIANFIWPRYEKNIEHMKSVMNT